MKTRNKLIGAISIFSCAFLLLGFFVALPVFLGIKEKSEKFLAKRNENSSYFAQSLEIEKYNSNLSVYRQNLDFADTMLVDSKNPVDFIEFIEDSAKEADVESDIVLLPQSQQPSQGAWREMIFKIKCTGGFSDILKFTNIMENSKYLISGQKLTIVPKAQKTGEKIRAGFLEAEFLIKVLTK